MAKRKRINGEVVYYRFPRICAKCLKTRFVPTGKYQVVCDKCVEENHKRKVTKGIRTPLRFPRPCLQCQKRYQPIGKYQKYCQECINSKYPKRKKQ